jgi:hypothetical protein
MRLLWSLIMLTALTIEGQQPDAPCGPKGQGLLSDAYFDGVMEQIARPTSEPFLVSLSFLSSSEIRFVLRTDGKKFELWKGTAQTRIYQTLEAADARCELPMNPRKAASLIRMEWQRAELPKATFDQLHREFTEAVTKHASIAQSEYDSLLRTNSFSLYLDTPGYVVVYDNHMEQMKIRTTDSNDARGRADPMNKWVHAIMELAADRLTSK